VARPVARAARSATLGARRPAWSTRDVPEAPRRRRAGRSSWGAGRRRGPAPGAADPQMRARLQGSQVLWERSRGSASCGCQPGSGLGCRLAPSAGPRRTPSVGDEERCRARSERADEGLVWRRPGENVPQGSEHQHGGGSPLLRHGKCFRIAWSTSPPSSRPQRDPLIAHMHHNRRSHPRHRMGEAGLDDLPVHDAHEPPGRSPDRSSAHGMGRKPDIAAHGHGFESDPGHRKQRRGCRARSQGFVEYGVSDATADVPRCAQTARRPLNPQSGAARCMTIRPHGKPRRLGVAPEFNDDRTMNSFRIAESRFVAHGQRSLLRRHDITDLSNAPSRLLFAPWRRVRGRVVRSVQRVDRPCGSEQARPQRVGQPKTEEHGGQGTLLLAA